MLPNPDIFGPASLAMTQGITAFYTFLPKFSDVRKNDPSNNPDFAADVRMGEVAAVTVTMGIGLIASSITGSSAPAIVAAITCGVLIFLYESTLRAQRPLEKAKGEAIVTSGYAVID